MVFFTLIRRGEIYRNEEKQNRWGETSEAKRRTTQWNNNQTRIICPGAPHSHSHRRRWSRPWDIGGRESCREEEGLTPPHKSTVRTREGEKKARPRGKEERERETVRDSEIRAACSFPSFLPSVCTVLPLVIHCAKWEGGRERRGACNFFGVSPPSFLPPSPLCWGSRSK